MIKRFTLKKFILFTLLSLLTAASFFAVDYSRINAFAANDESAYKIAYDTESEFSYSRTEKIDYTDETYCKIMQPETARYDGIYGKTAIKKTSQNKTYQLYFSNAFKSNVSYEISFFAKFESPTASTYVNVYYTDEDKKYQYDNLPQLKGKDGEWVKYSFTLKSNAAYEKLFKLTIECKNFSPETNVYFDEFHAYEVDDFSPLISGENADEKDWTLLGDVKKSGFNDESDSVAYTLRSNAEITSKFIEVPQSGLLRIKFAYNASDDAKLYFGIKDVFGNVVSKTELTVKANKASCGVVTSDLKKYDFVRIFFSNEGNGPATAGLIEAVGHTHEFVSDGKYPIYDLFNCKTIQLCKICGFEAEFVRHEMRVVKEPTCGAEGRSECDKCDYYEVIPATGEHVYDRDVTCSKDNKYEYVCCTECGELLWLRKEHEFEYSSLGESGHVKKCTACGYSEQSGHTVGKVTLVKAPTQTETGVAACKCTECGDAYMVTLPDLSSEEWNKTTVTEVGCETDGLNRYRWAKGELSVDETIEATGHEYEEKRISATCTTEGKSAYHQCRVCGHIAEDEKDIVIFAPYGHSETEWITEVNPTTRRTGLQRKYCNRCKEKIDERVVPKLNAKDYEKYILENPETSDGYLYRYTSKIYGTFTEFEAKENDDKILAAVVISAFAVSLIVAVAVFVLFTKKKDKVK